MIIKNARLFIDGEFVKKDFKVENGLFSDFGDFENKADYDFEGLKIIPGLTDIHIHGAVSFDSCDGKVESIEKIAEYEMKHGITQFMPTTMTFNEEKLSKVFSAIGSYDNSFAQVVGIHMEGPFISHEKIGAQNPAYIARPNVEMTKRLDALSGGLLKIISVAPEVEGAIDYAKNLKDDYIISVAHTAANYEEAKVAFKGGFSHLTHCFNAMNPIHHRKPGVIPAAHEAGATVELITDGLHIHEAIIRMTFDLFGEDKMILVSDSNEATGLDDGLYELGGQKIEVRGNKATLFGTDTIAGSVTNLFDCLKHSIKIGIDERMAIKAASVNPAKKIGIIDKVGAIKKGLVANFLVVDNDYNLKYVFMEGKERWKN